MKFELILFFLLVPVFTFLLLTDQAQVIQVIREMFTLAVVLIAFLFLFSVATVYFAVKFRKNFSLDPADLFEAAFIDKEHLSEITRVLESFEFRRIGDFKAEFMKSAEFYERILVNDGGTIVARVGFGKGKGGQVSVLSFSSSFKDGSLLVTTNTQDRIGLKEVAWATGFRHPRYSVKELLTKHQEHLKEVEGKKATAALKEDVVMTIEKDTRKLLEDQTRLGLLREDRSGNYYRYTLYGAFYALAISMVDRLKIFEKEDKAKTDKRFGTKPSKRQIATSALVVVIVFGGYLISLYTRDYPNVETPQDSCNLLYRNIENLFERYNYCTVDEDCQSVQLGGAYVEFGCWKYLNKSYDVTILFEQLDEYVSQCSTPINKCRSIPAAVCRVGQCVEGE